MCGPRTGRRLSVWSKDGEEAECMVQGWGGGGVLDIVYMLQRFVCLFYKTCVMMMMAVMMMMMITCILSSHFS